MGWMISGPINYKLSFYVFKCVFWQTSLYKAYLQFIVLFATVEQIFLWKPQYPPVKHQMGNLLGGQASVSSGFQIK